LASCRFMAASTSMTTPCFRYRSTLPVSTRNTDGPPGMTPGARFIGAKHELRQMLGPHLRGGHLEDRPEGRLGPDGHDALLVLRIDVDRVQHG
jgi:hypothetical protein